MAAEAAVLGVPAVHVSTRRLGYTDELEARYGLVTNVAKAEDCLAAAARSLSDPRALAANRRRRDRYLEETDDLVAVAVDAVEEVRERLATVSRAS
jgi:hypothetical protein